MRPLARSVLASTWCATLEHNAGHGSCDLVAPLGELKREGCRPSFGVIATHGHHMVAIRLEVLHDRQVDDPCVPRQLADFCRHSDLERNKTLSMRINAWKGLLRGLNATLEFLDQPAQRSRLGEIAHLLSDTWQGDSLA